MLLGINSTKVHNIDVLYENLNFIKFENGFSCIICNCLFKSSFACKNLLYLS